MRRAELLHKASHELGRPIKPHHLDYAMRRGYVVAVERTPDGWNRYGHVSVKNLVAFMQNRSRSVSRQSN